MKELPSRRLKRLKETKKMLIGVTAAFLAAASIVIGTAIVPSDFEVPVILANGEVITPPWYVTVEGQKVALVDSEQHAGEVVKKVAEHYKNNKTVKIEIQEQTQAKEMKLKNGDKMPKIMTVEEAVAEITANQELTVKTTEVVTAKEAVGYKKVTQQTDHLYVGQTKVKTEGQRGLREVIKKITKENGKVIKTDVVEQTILEKPENQVILTGIKENPSGVATVSRGAHTRGETKRGTGRLAAPVSTLNVTSGFGPRWGRMHLGVDLGMPAGSPITAADDGTVIFTGYSGSYGNLIKIDHGNGIVTYYAHCSRIIAKRGQAVRKRELIAKVGSTGNSTGPHLHFEVRVNGQNVNPLNYL